MPAAARRTRAAAEAPEEATRPAVTVIVPFISVGWTVQ